MDSLTETQNPKTESRIKSVINSNIEVPSQLVTLRFNFNDHIIDNRLLRVIDKDNIRVVTGELDWFNNIPQLIKNPQTVTENSEFSNKPGIMGVGESKEGLQEHYSNINKLLKKGVVFATTDADSFFAFDPRLQDVRSFYIGLGGLLVSAGASSAVFVNEGSPVLESIMKRKVDRREFLQKTPKALVGLGALFKLGDLDFISNDAKVKIEQFLLSKFDPAEFEHYHQMLITLRNRIMSLNTWHLLEQRRNTQPQTNILFFAGSAHYKSENEFLKGPDVLTEEVRGYAYKLLTHTIDFLKKQNLSEDEFYKRLIDYSEVFQDVYIFGNNIYFDANKDVKTSSARDILYHELNNQIKQYSSDTERTAIFKRLLIEISVRDRDRNKALNEFNTE